MSTILDRLHAAFRGTPIVLAPIRARGRPGPAQLRELADHLAALANHSDGGILVLGIDAEPAIAVRGVSEPKVWAAATRRVAAHLVPPVPVEVEVGEERGRAVLAAQVPFVPVPHGLVRRRDGAPTRLVDGRPVPVFRPLKGAVSQRLVAPILAPVERSTPAWLDPEATRALAPRAPAAWSPATREAMAREGLLAADGVAVTRAGMLLAGLAEQRAEADGVIVEADSRVVDLPRGWLLLRDDLRFEARQAGVRHADLVADLVVDVLVRTAGPAAAGPLVVDLSPDLLTIEAPGPIRDDAHVARLMARGAWRQEAWKAAAIGWHLPVTWERHGAGLRVVARLVRPERVAPRRVEAAPAPATIAITTPQPETPPTVSEVHVARSTREDAVLELLADGRSWSRRELDARLGWSRSTLRNVLEGLVTAGRVVTEAPSARSPHQAYRRAA